MGEIYRFKLTDLDRFHYRTGAKVLMRAEDGEWCQWEDVAPRLKELLEMHNEDVKELGRLRREVFKGKEEGVLYG